MTERERFAVLAQSGRFTVGELCRDFGISRKTGHKYLKRYRSDGREGLADRSRRPKKSPNATAKSVEALILKERAKRPTWGPKKIRDLLIKVHKVEQPPHESTIALTLSRHGLSQKRKRKSGAYRVRPEHLTEPTRPNQVWTVDFKGWFILEDGQRCDPLTVCDRFSRYIIACRGCATQQFRSTLRVFKKMMRHYGVPEIIRVDNGTPFASNSLGGLSQLSIWWIEQGIRVEFMTPASPQENGSHERMHRDLKAEATKPPSKNMRAQKKRLERWRSEYNNERPHESLDMLRPAEIYRKSAHRLGEKDKIRYPEGHQAKRVSISGHITHCRQSIYLSEIFGGCIVSVFENASGVSELHYSNLHIGNIEYNFDDPYRPGAGVISPKTKPLQPQPAKAPKKPK